MLNSPNFLRCFGSINTFLQREHSYEQQICREISHLFKEHGCELNMSFLKFRISQNCGIGKNDQLSIKCSQPKLYVRLILEQIPWHCYDRFKRI